MTNEHKNEELKPIDLSILLGDLLGMARRFWWVAVLLMVLLAGFFSFRAWRSYVPQYEASASFTVHVADPLQSDVRSYNTGTADQMAKTFPYILTSTALKDVVMRQLDMPWLPPINASVSTGTNIFTLTVTAPQPQQAYDVLQAVIEHYPEVAEFVVGPTVLDLLDESGVPEVPLNQLSISKSALKGILMGAAVWLLLLLVMVLSRSTVHNEDEIKQLMNVSCLGDLPRVRLHGKLVECPRVTDEQCGRGFAESVRLIRVRVEKEMQTKGMKVLLISSATPGEGKTTVAINLAQTLAMKGKRTLLVDCDLRNPSVARNLKMQNTGGLVDLLQGSAASADIIQETETPMLFVTVAGGPVEEAAELLAHRAFHDFVEECRGQFDYVILDTPPVSLLVDASEIAGEADTALLVVRQNYASRSQILEGAQLLADGGLPLAGCMLNYTAGSVFGGSYGHGYSYGYGYGYGHYGHYGHYGQPEDAVED